MASPSALRVRPRAVERDPAVTCPYWRGKKLDVTFGMQYTNLGSTGMTVSRICLGCMSYGTSKWRPWVLDESDALPFYRRALDAGINFFDTADMYSLGVSEEVTGRALRSMARMDEIVLATKVYNAMSDGPNMKGLSRKHITQGVEEIGRAHV